MSVRHQHAMVARTQGAADSTTADAINARRPRHSGDECRWLCKRRKRQRREGGEHRPHQLIRWSMRSIGAGGASCKGPGSILARRWPWRGPREGSCVRRRGRPSERCLGTKIGRKCRGKVCGVLVFGVVRKGSASELGGRAKTSTRRPEQIGAATPRLYRRWKGRDRTPHYAPSACGYPSSAFCYRCPSPRPFSRGSAQRRATRAWAARHVRAAPSCGRAWARGHVV